MSSAMDIPGPGTKPNRPERSKPADANSITAPTVSPVDCLQGQSREDYISDLVESITSGDLLNDSSTPQGKALSFLVNDDPLLEDPCTASTTRIQQRYGLSTFYYSMEGENWVDPSGWLSGDDECTWFGVECHEDDDTVKYLRLSTSFLSNLVVMYLNHLLLFTNFSFLFGTSFIEIKR